MWLGYYQLFFIAFLSMAIFFMIIIIAIVIMIVSLISSLFLNFLFGLNFGVYIPADTRRRFNVFKESMRRVIGVEMTLYVYWDTDA